MKEYIITIHNIAPGISKYELGMYIKRRQYNSSILLIYNISIYI